MRDRVDANRDGWDYCTQWARTYERLGNTHAAQQMRSARWELNPYGPDGRGRER